jgi:hypothetical protein
VFPKGFFSIAIGVAKAFSSASTTLHAAWDHMANPALATRKK